MISVAAQFIPLAIHQAKAAANTISLTQSNQSCNCLKISSWRMPEHEWRFEIRLPIA
jgi:uncharacterized protein YmfQ (DUF2313 family)